MCAPCPCVRVHLLKSFLRPRSVHDLTSRSGLETQAKVAVGEGEEGGREEEGDKKEEGGGCDKVWIGVLDRHVLEIRQTPTTTLVRRVGASVDEGRVEGGREGEVEDKVLMARLQDYFQVNVSGPEARKGEGEEKSRRAGEQQWGFSSLLRSG